MANNIKFEIVNHIATLSTSPKGWTKELNLVSWNDADPKYDLRDWAPEHDKMGKGVTLTVEEAVALGLALLGEDEEPEAQPEEPKEEPTPAPAKEDHQKTAADMASKMRAAMGGKK